jgi:copper homeostasis protein (lipoprotein)
MLQRLLILAAALALAGAARAEPLVLGPFLGVLPCADCAGISTELTLRRKAEGWAEGSYVLRELRADKRRPAVVSGPWTTLRGDAIDDDAVVYQLDPNDPMKSRHFLKVGDRTVQALDDNLRPLPAGQPSTLRMKDRRR